MNQVPAVPSVGLDTIAPRDESQQLTPPPTAWSTVWMPALSTVCWGTEGPEADLEGVLHGEQGEGLIQQFGTRFAFWLCVPKLDSVMVVRQGHPVPFAGA